MRNGWLLKMRSVFHSKRFFSIQKPPILELSELTALGPLDGRYASKVSKLRNTFSEFALIKQRVKVETKWVEHLSKSRVFKEIPLFQDKDINTLNNIGDNFSIKNAERVKEIEKITNHDVKAVEYFIKEELCKLSEDNELRKSSEFVHFGCTSEDVNNLSYGLMLKEARNNIFLPKCDEILTILREISINNKEIAMLSRTHGQPATPTTIGKEFSNFTVRLCRQRKRIKNVEILGKFNGAVGNFAAHKVTMDFDWLTLSNNFISDLNLVPNNYTTQIEPHDFIGELSDGISAFNTILLDLSKDMWGYISLGYFTQKNIKGQIGSSTMPHKINPIDFENCEGNLEIANAMFSLFKRKLPISRYQRDLSDSTVLRALGVAFGHSMLAYSSLLRGLNKISVNEDRVLEDLDNNVEVLSEPIQMVLRRYSAEQPYEQLKELTRGKKLSLKEMRDFIDTLDLPTHEKQKLLALTPSNYIGLSSHMASDHLDKTLNELGFKV